MRPRPRFQPYLQPYGKRRSSDLLVAAEEVAVVRRDFIRHLLLDVIDGVLGHRLARGEHAAERAADQHAARDTHGGLHGACHEAAPLALLVLRVGIGRDARIAGLGLPLIAPLISPRRVWRGTGLALLGATAEQAPEQPASPRCGTAAKLLLKFLDAGLGLRQSLLLDDDSLGH